MRLSLLSAGCRTGPAQLQLRRQEGAAAWCIRAELRELVWKLRRADGRRQHGRREPGVSSPAAAGDRRYERQVLSQQGHLWRTNRLERHARAHEARHCTVARCVRALVHEPSVRPLPLLLAQRRLAELHPLFGVRAGNHDRRRLAGLVSERTRGSVNTLHRLQQQGQLRGRGRSAG